MENKTKHHTTFSCKSLLLLFISGFYYNKNNKNKVGETKTPPLITHQSTFVNGISTEVILMGVFFLLIAIININIGTNFTNSQVSNYINIFYIFLIISLYIIIILNNLDNMKDGRISDIKSLIPYFSLGLIVLFLIDGLILKGKISNWILNKLTNKTNNNNEDEDEDEVLQEKSILLLDDGLNYILFFVFLYIFLQTMTYIIKKINNIINDNENKLNSESNLYFS
jgi:uncharacterized membrane protein (GlpM family)